MATPRIAKNGESRAPPRNSAFNPPQSFSHTLGYWFINPHCSRWFQCPSCEQMSVESESLGSGELHGERLTPRNVLLRRGFVECFRPLVRSRRGLVPFTLGGFGSLNRAGFLPPRRLCWTGAVRNAIGQLSASAAKILFIAWMVVRPRPSHCRRPFFHLKLPRFSYIGAAENPQKARAIGIGFSVVLLNNVGGSTMTRHKLNGTLECSTCGTIRLESQTTPIPSPRYIAPHAANPWAPGATSRTLLFSSATASSR